MSKNLKFVWIDDDDEREIACTNLERYLGIKCHFVNVKPKNIDFMSVIDSVIDKVKPDLILLDHNLTDIGTGAIKKGSTISALIREKNPTCAIACITAQDILSIDSQQRMSYESIFSYDDITDHYPTMQSIALGYRKMKSNLPKNINDLFNLMKVPKEEQIRLETILPHDIKENFSDQGIYTNISHWIRDVLIERPGFLYDNLWAATILGLNVSGFKKIETLFAPAKYRGIFANESKERWWKCELTRILSKHVKTNGLPWEKGRKLPSITARHYSKDYYSNFIEEFPETVAFLDETTSEREQMKLKYTVPHPKFDKLLFFEEIKMMKADQS